MFGKWHGHKIALTGDYTKIEEFKLMADDENERFKDITEKVAEAVWAVQLANALLKSKIQVDMQVQAQVKTQQDL